MIRWNLVLSFWATLFIPLLYLVNIFIIFSNRGTFEAPYTLTLLGLFISIIGLLLWIISLLNLGRSFGVLPQKQKKIRKGLYKYLSHPMYIGIYITFLGLSLSYKSWQGLTFLNLVLLPLLFVRAIFEERYLN